MGKKIIVAGHICIDITPAFKNKRVTEISDVLRPGKLIDMGNATVSTGGAVANTGIAMKLLGADVKLMGKIGCDEFGDMVCKILEKYDAKSEMIRSEEVSTSYTVVLAVPGIDRIFLHNPGANNDFYASDINDNAIREADLLHFGYPTIMRSMYLNEGAETVELLKRVKALGCATSLDLSAVDDEAEAGRVNWKRVLEKAIPYVDFFVPSVEELCYMLDRERFDEWQRRAEGRDITEILDIEKDVRPLADKCMALGTKILLLKCGLPGMYLRTASKEVLDSISTKVGLDTEQWADIELFEKSYIPERILSGTGAGDTSIAAFLVSVLNGERPEMCMHLSAGTGASCVAAYDSLSGLKSFDELKEKIKNGWKKISDR